MGRFKGGYTNYNQRTALLTREEEKLRDENLQMRPYYDDNGIRQLWAAVAIRALKDYKMATYGRFVETSVTVKECEEFFNSDAFGELTNGCSAKEVRTALLNGDLDTLIYGGW